MRRCGKSNRKAWLQEQLNALLENLIARFVLDGLFPITAAAFGFAGGSVSRQKKIGRSMPVVAATKQIPNRRKSPLNSRAQIYGGSQSRFVRVRRKNLHR